MGERPPPTLRSRRNTSGWSDKEWFWAVDLVLFQWSSCRDWPSQSPTGGPKTFSETPVRSSGSNLQISSETGAPAVHQDQTNRSLYQIRELREPQPFQNIDGRLFER